MFTFLGQESSIEILILKQLYALVNILMLLLSDRYQQTEIKDLFNTLDINLINFPQSGLVEITLSSSPNIVMQCKIASTKQPYLKTTFLLKHYLWPTLLVK